MQFELACWPALSAPGNIFTRSPYAWLPLLPRTRASTNVTETKQMHIYVTKQVLLILCTLTPLPDTHLRLETCTCFMSSVDQTKLTCLDCTSDSDSVGQEPSRAHQRDRGKRREHIAPFQSSFLQGIHDFTDNATDQLLLLKFVIALWLAVMSSHYRIKQLILQIRTHYILIKLLHRKICKASAT